MAMIDVMAMVVQRWFNGGLMGFNQQKW